MKYIIRMSMNWKDRLEYKENIVFLKEDIKDNTIEIEVEDIDNFTSKNNFHIEYEILMPVLIKLGLTTVGVIVSPNFRDKEAEDLMIEMFKRHRKFGVSLTMDIKNYDDIEEKRNE